MKIEKLEEISALEWDKMSLEELSAQINGTLNSLIKNQNAIIDRLNEEKPELPPHKPIDMEALKESAKKAADVMFPDEPDKECDWKGKLRTEYFEAYKGILTHPQINKSCDWLIDFIENNVLFKPDKLQDLERWVKKQKCGYYDGGYRMDIEDLLSKIKQLREE